MNYHCSTSAEPHHPDSNRNRRPSKAPFLPLNYDAVAIRPLSIFSPRRTLISCASRPAQIKRILLGSCCCVYGTPPLSIHTQTKQDASLRRVFILQRLKRAVIPTAAAEPNRLTRSKRLLRDSGYGMISFSVTASHEFAEHFV